MGWGGHRHPFALVILFRQSPLRNFPRRLAFSRFWAFSGMWKPQYLFARSRSLSRLSVLFMHPST